MLQFPIKVGVKLICKKSVPGFISKGISYSILAIDNNPYGPGRYRVHIASGHKNIGWVSSKEIPQYFTFKKIVTVLPLP